MSVLVTPRRVCGTWVCGREFDRRDVIDRRVEPARHGRRYSAHRRAATDPPVCHRAVLGHVAAEIRVGTAALPVQP